MKLKLLKLLLVPKRKSLVGGLVVIPRKDHPSSLD